MEDEFAVNRYQISSSGAARQDGAGSEVVAFSVLALTEVEQATPNGTVLISVAPLQSSLAGACAFVLTKAIPVKNSIR